MSKADQQTGIAVTDNEEIANALRRIAEMLEFKEENPFKIRSYQTAAENIGSMDESVAEIVSGGGAAELQKIPGIGKAISAQIVEIAQTGKSSYFAEITQDVPATVIDLRKVSGIGLKTARLLYRDYGIKSLEELSVFAASGALAAVPGMGSKTLERVKASLARALNPPATKI
ncbi:MAG: hypothetical protein DMF61_00205 [Blastocatellia bacterium AA13]|nr:MAG: hypothetical protein DMF61_00205 [Blastocatellia bacterium AA13]